MGIAALHPSYELLPIVPPRRMPRKTRPLLRRLRSCRQGARWARRKLARVPRAIRIAGSRGDPACGLHGVNLVYQVIRKPTELFFFVGHRLDKEPSETWRQYGSLFRAYSTSTITPELLAALAQIESSGNPVDRTYWRWRWSFNPFAIYQPASSAVGLTQMTDRSLRRGRAVLHPGHAVSDTGCGFTRLYVRAIPSHAIELASVYLDRNVADVLARAGDVKPSPSERQDLAAFIHLCGGGPATAYARRKFQMIRRRALRRSPRLELCRQGQCDEAAVPAACGGWRGLALAK